MLGKRSKFVLPSKYCINSKIGKLSFMNKNQIFDLPNSFNFEYSKPNFDSQGYIQHLQTLMSKFGRRLQPEHPLETQRNIKKIQFAIHRLKTSQGVWSIPIYSGGVHECFWTKFEGKSSRTHHFTIHGLVLQLKIIFIYFCITNMI